MSAEEHVYGYNGTILRIDLTTRTHGVERPGEGFWRRYAGGGLAATHLLIRETTPGVDPLGEGNLLIFASSVVAGLDAPGLARFTTVAKSPLTGGVGETRTEGPWGPALKAVGTDLVVFSGRSPEPVFVELGSEVVTGGEPTVKVTYHLAGDVWGATTGDATSAIERRLGRPVHVATIGPAGENLVRFASIVTDRGHQASRMGMGAVMGSKNLKAVVLRPGASPRPYDPAALATIKHHFESAIGNNDLSSWQRKPPGFSCWIYLHGMDASICVENYRKSTIEHLDAYAEEQYAGRQIEPLACPGCANNCIKSIRSEVHAGDHRMAGIHQEVTGTMGPNLGIADLEFVLRANERCNELGIDPTSLGFTISAAMEWYAHGIIDDDSDLARPLRFGDSDATLSWIEDIAYRRGFGDTLAEGSRRAAQSVGGDAARYAMEVKGLEMVPFEPRSQTNLALGYAVAPVGPRYDICEHDWDFDTEVGWDHTLRYSRTIGILDRVPMGYLGPEKVRNFKALFTLWSAADALDFCIFAVAPTRILSLRDMATVLHAATGWETSSYEIMRLGLRRAHLMRLYNLREGLRAEEDVLPDRFYDEPIAEGPQAGAVLDRDRFVEAVQTFYAMMGWDSQGVPTDATLLDFDLGWAVDVARGLGAPGAAQT